MEKEKVGFIYILTNESFHRTNWVKIGYATNVERRVAELSNTAVPLPYEIYATYEIPASKEMNKSDKYLHKLIESINPELRISKNREFFEIEPEDAYNLLLSIAKIHDREEKLVCGPSKRSNKESESMLNENEILNSENVIFYLKSKKRDVDARGYLKDHKFTILKGSRISTYCSQKFDVSLRRKLENSGYIINRVFVQDFEFDSPSGAGTLAMGNSTNGWAEWRDINGKTLNAYRLR